MDPETGPQDIGPTRVPGREGLSEEKARDADRLLGKKLGAYLVLREIGRGGMGIVFEGDQEGLSRKVAIKVLPTSLLSSQSLVDRFLREARASARLQHPNIVKVLSVGREADVHYFAMEFIVGSSLEDILERETRVSSYYGMDVFRQVASALGYSHSQGVIHRDIKPANIMVDPSGKVTVTDFGIAKSIEEPGLTATGELLGTPSYMSPEQARGQETDARTDIYSLGVMMYECLTGRLPFEAESALAVLRKIVEAELQPPRQVRPELDGDSEYIILRSMSRDPNKRYQTAEELLADIEKYQKGIPVRRRDDLDSAEEARLRSLMRELFGRVFAAFKIMSLYLPDHRNVKESTIAAYGILKEILKRKSPVTVSLAEGSVLVEGRDLDASDPALRRFADQLVRLKVSSLTFADGVTEDEFLAFLRTLGMRDEMLSREGGIATVLAARGVSHVRVDEVVYRKVSRLEADGRNDRQALDEVAVTSYLLRSLSELRGPHSDLLDDLLHRPADVGKLILRAVSTLDPSMLGSGANPQANVIVESLDRIGEDVLGGRLGGWGRYKKNLAEILLTLDPAILQQQVLLTDSPAADELVRKAASEFPDEQVVGICVATWRRTRSLPSVRTLAQRLLADTDRYQRVLPALKAQLLAEGMSAQDFDWVVHRRLLTDLSFGDKVKKLLVCEPELMVKLGAVDQVSEILDTLFTTERREEGTQILNRYLANFASGDEGVKRQAIEEFVSLLKVALKVGDEALLKGIEEALLGAARREEEPAPFTLLCEYMEAICSHHLEAKKPEATADIVGFLVSHLASQGKKSSCAREAVSRLAKKEVVEHWLGELARGRDDATDVLAAFGEAAVPALLDRLADTGETRGDLFEAHQRDRKIAAVLRRIGEPAVRQAASRLSDPDWQKVRSIVRVFEGIVEDPALAKLLAPALGHPDPRVRKAAVLALERIGGKKAQSMLYVASVYDMDKEVSESASLAHQNTLRRKRES